MAALRPAAATAARRVLEALGDEVYVLDGRCCGQPAFNSGFQGEARAAGRELLREARHFEAVVTPSGSCVSMVKHYLPGLFEGGRAAGAERIADAFREFGEYVAGHPRLESLQLRLPGVVAYHDSCHARRELGLTGTLTGLLARVQGLELRRLAFEDECCGFGGTFSAKLPEVSAAMRDVKLDDIRASGVRVVVSSDLSCLAHLEAGARGGGFAAWTIAEVLARALEAHP
jgi:L-lactate dehydrogenase complex protein LldE